MSHKAAPVYALTVQQVDKIGDRLHLIRQVNAVVEHACQAEHPFIEALHEGIGALSRLQSEWADEIDAVLKAADRQAQEDRR